ncbi:dihydrolipoyl dehydrogenase family protein [Agromyces archimandritae]|uniref:NAD(P)/FAD-dependent oxidoreductase n=1 Tax=Agromyces archimandritae TaxID=2781962 RepID=A0A975IP17_9MICO|nr:NAD(P)/FAD-dependent oxidoreductase [Agromyces archimandritae]QTX05183.1 NAD(P)/FAD-dependent oxidoreductase [Agromyces archimandritae]
MERDTNASGTGGASTEIETDVVVIGAGPVGENVADRTVQGGLDTVIVEHELVGGECSYWACVPSKALLRPGAALRAARRVPGAAEAAGGHLDAARMLAHRDEEVADWNDDGQVAWVESAGIRLVRGHGRLDGPKRVIVTGPDGAETVIHARHAVAVATGSEPVIPPVPGLAEAHPWMSREATAVQEVPERLAIIGGGVVAVEAATWFADLGTRVTVIARHGLLERMEPFAGEAVARGLAGLGVDVRLNSQAVRVERRGDEVLLDLGDGDTLVADDVLVGTGRRPRTEGLGLDTAGLGSTGHGSAGHGSAGHGRLDVDDSMTVDTGDRIPWLYAVGDVNGRSLLTHEGKYQARAAGDTIAVRAEGRAVLDAGPWGAHVATADHRAVPQVVFGEPEVAAVGRTEAEARAAGMAVRVADYEIGHVAGAGLHAKGYEGRARLVVDDTKHVVVGATFVGQDVAELLHAATIAIVGEVPVHRLWHAVPAFPTMSEVWLRLLEELGRDTAASGGNA